jgi:hypothetical protein
MIVCMLLLLCGAQVYAQKGKVKVQQEDTLKPYQKYPELPAFNILLQDSSTIFNTYNIEEGQPVAIMFFDPECKHCRHTMAALLPGMDSIKNVRFYLVTPQHNVTALRNFYKEFRLADYKNIEVVGRDYEFFFITNYGTKNLPDVALYDAQKKLITLIEGEFTASDIYRYTH